MTTAASTPKANQTQELAPRFGIPIGLIIISLPLLWVQPWLGLGFSLLGLFLTLQTVLIRLRFTNTSLEVYRSQKLIRSFPYGEWQNWRLFWEPVPLLFYFKEVKSIHFLPVIFDAKALKACLEKHCAL